VGIGLTLLAALLGGSHVPIEGEIAEGPVLGLDWFLLRLVLFSILFIPIERVFPLVPEQSIFRWGWRTDLVYFFVGAPLVQVTTLLTVRPAMVFFSWAVHPAVQNWVRSQPFVLQFVEILVLTDLMQYWVHRLFHTIPALWRIHAIHHAAESMDWLAGSRLHFVDLAVTRALTYVPIYILGFDETPLYAYVAVVSIWATFIHANVRLDLGPLDCLLAAPRFHHWHHGAQREAIDKNFAVHLPVLDWLFGTYYMPRGRWPASYGLVGGAPIPDGFLKQFVHPFRREKPREASKTSRTNSEGVGVSECCEHRGGSVDADTA
jgi:lathosterol oxidase